MCDRIDVLEAQLATAKAAKAVAETATETAEAATAAAQAEAAEWRQRFSELLGNTQARVKQQIDWVDRLRASASQTSAASEPEVSDTTPSGH